MQLESNILNVDFTPKALPKAKGKVKAVKELEANAARLNVVLVRKPVVLDDKWVAWHKAIVNG